MTALQNTVGLDPVVSSVIKVYLCAVLLAMFDAEQQNRLDHFLFLDYGILTVKVCPNVTSFRVNTCA